MNTLQTTILSGFVGLLLVTTNAIAAQSNLEKVSTKNTKPHITLFRSGGIGGQSQHEMQSLDNKGVYNVKLTTALETGHYVADVAVMITDKDGNVVVDTKSEGPLFYVDLKPGTYDVLARYGDTVRKQTIKVNADNRLKHVVFRWKPAKPASS